MPVRLGGGDGSASQLGGANGPGWKGLTMHNLQKSLLLVSLVVVFIVMGAIEPRFLTLNNIVNIARQISINLIIAVGMTFCMIGGGFDLSVGSVGAMAGCLTGIVIVKTGSTVLGVGVGLLAGLAAGLLNGLSITKLKVNAFVTTLGMMVVARLGVGFDAVEMVPLTFGIATLTIATRIAAPSTRGAARG